MGGNVYDHNTGGGILINIEYFEEKNIFKLKPDSFKYNGYIRELPNRRWSNKEQVWLAPAIKLNAITILQILDKTDIRFADDSKMIIDGLLGSGIKNKKFPRSHKTVYKPYAHQYNALDAAYTKKAFGFFMDMGTGKTKVIIDLMNHYFKKGEVKTVIILCPNSLKSTWRDQIVMHSKNKVDISVVDSQNRYIYKIPTTENLKFYVCNLEALSREKKSGRFYSFLLDELKKEANTAIVCDEAHFIKTHSSNRTINAIELASYAKYRYALTGTPITQGIMDLYSIFEFLDKTILGAGSFYSFRNRYAVMGGWNNKQIVDYKNIEELTQIIEPHIFQVKKEDCLDLPPKVFLTREVDLMPEQRHIYNMIRKTSAYIFDEGNQAIVCKNILDKYLKYQQIVSGFIVEENEKDERATPKALMEPKKNPKIKELCNIIDENPQKSVIVWCKFVWEVHEISMVLNDKYGAVSMFYGGLTVSEREESVTAFLEGETKYFVAIQQVGGTGLTLNVSDLVVYFSNTFKYADRVQSEDRCHRIGQTKTVTYIDLIANDTVDKRILTALENKQNISDYVTDLLKEGVTHNLM